ncbi:hypothetical protein ACP4OV_020451 [Aristida adscensionis]
MASPQSLLFLTPSALSPPTLPRLAATRPPSPPRLAAHRFPRLAAHASSPPPLAAPPPPPPPGGGFGDGGGGAGGGGGLPDSGDGWWWPRWLQSLHPGLLLLLLLLQPGAAASALAEALGSIGGGGSDDAGVWEVRGGTRTRLVPDPTGASYRVAGDGRFPRRGGGDEKVGGGGGREDLAALRRRLEQSWRWCAGVAAQLLLPDGYPHSVSSDYLQYSLWRGVQGVASQVSGVLSTQALLYAVGLGKGAIPTAAAVNWILKDGLGYLSKIMLSKFGRHFDVNPKGWRLFADLLENTAYGLEIMTPVFPHLFVPIGAAAGAGRSAAALIQSATRSCFYAGFAVQRNFAEVIAKGEAQGMVSKFIGIALGIALANQIGSSVPLALISFAGVTAVHMYCNLKSYQSIQLRTLNPYRASLVFSEYLLSGQVPSVKEVNDEEPLFLSTSLGPSRKQSGILSAEAKDAAERICRRLRLGSKLSEIIESKEDAYALFDLYKNEQYLLTNYRGKFCIVLKEGSSPEDMLKSLFHVNYLYWLERYMGFKPSNVAMECRPGGWLEVSLDYAQREFSHVKHDGSCGGWVMDGLIARPLPVRIRIGDAIAS